MGCFSSRTSCCERAGPRRLQAKLRLKSAGRCWGSGRWQISCLMCSECNQPAIGLEDVVMSHAWHMREAREPHSPPTRFQAFEQTKHCQ